LKTPTWDEVLDFLRYDGWRHIRSSGHEFYERVLPDGEILQTHASRSGSKAMSPGRFKAILSDQLHVSEDAFWTVLRTKEPAPRPDPDPWPAPASLPLWLVSALEREGALTRQEIAALDEPMALARLTEIRSRPRP
jgi:hypothetical protein